MADTPIIRIRGEVRFTVQQLGPKHDYRYVATGPALDDPAHGDVVLGGGTWAFLQHRVNVYVEQQLRLALAGGALHAVVERNGWSFVDPSDVVRCAVGSYPNGVRFDLPVLLALAP